MLTIPVFCWEYTFHYFRSPDFHDPIGNPPQNISCFRDIPILSRLRRLWVFFGFFDYISILYSKKSKFTADFTLSNVKWTHLLHQSKSCLQLVRRQVLMQKAEQFKEIRSVQTEGHEIKGGKKKKVKLCKKCYFFFIRTFEKTNENLN